MKSVTAKVAESEKIVILRGFILPPWNPLRRSSEGSAGPSFPGVRPRSVKIPGKIVPEPHRKLRISDPFMPEKSVKSRKAGMWTARIITCYGADGRCRRESRALSALTFNTLLARPPHSGIHITYYEALRKNE